MMLIRAAHDQFQDDSQLTACSLLPPSLKALCPVAEEWFSFWTRVLPSPPLPASKIKQIFHQPASSLAFEWQVARSYFSLHF